MQSFGKKLCWREKFQLKGTCILGSRVSEVRGEEGERGAGGRETLSVEQNPGTLPELSPLPTWPQGDTEPGLLLKQ